MKVLEFLEKLENEYGHGLYRKINYHYKNNTKNILTKYPIDDYNNWEKNKVMDNRGSWRSDKINTYSFYIKYIQNLVCIDFDTKDINNNQLYQRLNTDYCWNTATKKGFHFYIFIDDLQEYSNEIRVGKGIDIDLINKKRNTWELPERDINGEEVHYEWNDLKDYFNEEKMNFESPPVSPTISPSNSEENMNEIVDEEEDDDMPPFQPIMQDYDTNELIRIVSKITSKYEYDDWIKVGLALYNITSGHEDGFNVWDIWSKKDTTNYCKEYLLTKWNNYMNNPDADKLIGIGSLKRWAEQDNPSNMYYKEFYKNAIIKWNEDGSFDEVTGKSNDKGLVHLLNENLLFIKETGDYIITDTKSSGEDTWFLKNSSKVKEHFEKYTFQNYFTGKKCNPYDLWKINIERSEVRAIGFNPSDNVDTNDIFNLWKGFKIDKIKASHYHEKDADPILDHILKIWCKNNLDSYNYVMDYFSHVLQKPDKKCGVVLCLKSKQGAGKGVILEKLAEIIGDNHYVQNSNANFLFGDFNGMLEAKILIDLDECFWGGDKKLESVVKNKITEKKQPINKKNKELYIIEDYANYIITTNNDWFAGVSEEDRRHYCLELDNILSGRMTDEKYRKIKPVLDAPAGAFAKVLYNRDIKNFNPRVFNKSPLLQDQVERNWNSVKVWFHECLKDGGFSLQNDKFVEWNKIFNDEYGNDVGGVTIKDKVSKKMITAYFKDFLYNCYNKSCTAHHKFHHDAFYRELKLNCLCDLFNEIRPFIQKHNGRSRFIILPSLKECRQNWNMIQDYDYEWDNSTDQYDFDPCLIDSDD